MRNRKIRSGSFAIAKLQAKTLRVLAIAIVAVIGLGMTACGDNGVCKFTITGLTPNAWYEVTFENGGIWNLSADETGATSEHLFESHDVEWGKTIYIYFQEFETVNSQNIGPRMRSKVRHTIEKGNLSLNYPNDFEAE